MKYLIFPLALFFLSAPGISVAEAKPSQARIADVKQRMASGKLVCGQTMNTSRKNPKPLAAKTVEALQWVCAGKN